MTTGWIRGVYPTRAVPEKALERGELFVAESDGEVVGAAIINKQQTEEYKEGNWTSEPYENEITVLHTLVISPKEAGKGYGKKFVDFYEQYALSHNSRYLRMDTNARNLRARALYKKLGYTEVGIVDCDFNGIPSVKMVLLEKILNSGEESL